MDQRTVNTAHVSQPLNRQLASIDLFAERRGGVVNVNHEEEGCLINETIASALLRVDAATSFNQKCGMSEPQTAISQWVWSMLKKHRLSVAQWAKLAKVGRDTIYRARDAGYEHTTSTSTLAKMAEALDEPPPHSEPFVGALNAAALSGVVTEIVQVLAPGTRVNPDLLQIVSEALQDIFAALAADPDAAADPAKSRAVARALMRRLSH